MTQQDELHKLLAGCISEEPGWSVNFSLAQLAELDWRGLLDLAADQRVSPLLYQQLKAGGVEHAVPAGIMSELRQRFLGNLMRNLRLYGCLRRMLGALRAAGLPVIVLKGAFLAEAVYGNVALREMNDVDLLVPVGALAEVADLFATHGYRPECPYTLETVLASKKDLPMLIKPNHPPFEIHWNLVPPGRPFSVDVGGFWERAIPARVAGVEVLVLSPPDLLLHLCSHLSHGHDFAFGLRPLCDIAATIRHFPEEIDWEVVITRAARLGWQPAAYLALLLARELVAAAVPEEALDGLRPEHVDAAIVTSARQQLFSDRAFSASLPLDLIRLRAPVRKTWRIRQLLKPLSRKAIARRYALPSKSLKVFLYYPVRFLHLLRQFGPTAYRLWRGERDLTRLAKRKLQLHDWLAGEKTD